MSTADASLIAAASRRRRWAYSLIGKAASPRPSYGSQAWLDLPEGSAEKVAAVVVAAECWAVDGDDILERLRRELSDQHDAEDRLRREQFDATVVPLVTALALRPHIGTTYAERRARELADALKPRPGDFLGRQRRSVQGPGDAA